MANLDPKKAIKTKQKERAKAKRRAQNKKAGFFIGHRSLLQGAWALLSNGQVGNFIKGRIYTGPGKRLCLPGLNCYSCPGALGSCPVGSFQAVVGSSKFNFSYYITGLLIFLGVIFGRLICGFFCPFGWFQDLVHKIPSKKISTKNWRIPRYIKYVIMVFVVWLFGVFLVNKSGMAFPYFCKYICPQGILEGGVPLIIANPGIRSAIGKLFGWKSLILLVFTGLSIFIYRPFCKWICPLGAFYSLFNRLSFYQYKVDKNKCINCGVCARVCHMDVDITKDNAALECIRCGECLKACPVSAISSGMFKRDLMTISAEDQRRIKEDWEAIQSPNFQNK